MNNSVPPITPQKIKPAARHRSRRLLVQALYQWQLTRTPPQELLKQFHEEAGMKKVDVPYFDELLIAILNQLEKLDILFKPYLDRDIKELDPISLSILRLSSYELSQRIDLPHIIVINEGIELAKVFGATDSYKYINGVLDKLARKLCLIEFKIPSPLQGEG